MLTIKRIAAVLMLLFVLGLSAPVSFADPGEIQTPPGEVNCPPGETNAPPGEVNGPPGPSSASSAGISAWLLFQMVANGWNTW